MTLTSYCEITHHRAISYPLGSTALICPTASTRCLQALQSQSLSSQIMAFARKNSYLTISPGIEEYPSLTVCGSWPILCVIIITWHYYAIFNCRGIVEERLSWTYNHWCWV